MEENSVLLNWGIQDTHGQLASYKKTSDSLVAQEQK